MTTQARGLIAIDKVGNKIRFYDPGTLAQASEITAPEPCVHELALTPDGVTAYVPLYGDGIYGTNKNPNNKVMAIDLASRATRAIFDLGSHLAPHGMAATRNHILWVACDIKNTLLAIDETSGAIRETHDIPGRGAHFVAMTADEKKLYCSNKEGDLAVFDLAARAFTKTLPMAGPGITAGNGSGSEGLALSPDGARLVTVDNFKSELHVIDTRDDREIDRVPLAMTPLLNVKRSRLHRLAFSPDGKILMVANYASALVWIINAADLRDQTVVAVAKGPQGIAFTPDGRHALVANHDSGIITRIDLATKQADAIYDGGQGIEVMAFY